MPSELIMTTIATDQLSRGEEPLAETPEWHQEVLTDRQHQLANGNEPVSDWNEAKQRLRHLSRNT